LPRCRSGTFFSVSSLRQSTDAVLCYRCVRNGLLSKRLSPRQCVHLPTKDACVVSATITPSSRRTSSAMAPILLTTRLFTTLIAHHHTRVFTAWRCPVAAHTRWYRAFVRRCRHLCCHVVVGMAWSYPAPLLKLALPPHNPLPPCCSEIIGSSVQRVARKCIGRNGRERGVEQARWSSASHVHCTCRTSLTPSPHSSIDLDRNTTRACLQRVVPPLLFSVSSSLSGGVAAAQSPAHTNEHAVTWS